MFFWKNMTYSGHASAADLARYDLNLAAIHTKQVAVVAAGWAVFLLVAWAALSATMLYSRGVPGPGWPRALQLYAAGTAALCGLAHTHIFRFESPPRTLRPPVGAVVAEQRRILYRLDAWLVLLLLYMVPAVCVSVALTVGLLRKYMGDYDRMGFYWVGLWYTVLMMYLLWWPFPSAATIAAAFPDI